MILKACLNSFIFTRLPKESKDGTRPDSLGREFYGCCATAEKTLNSGIYKPSFCLLWQPNDTVFWLSQWLSRVMLCSVYIRHHNSKTKHLSSGAVDTWVLDAVNKQKNCCGFPEVSGWPPFCNKILDLMDSVQSSMDRPSNDYYHELIPIKYLTTWNVQPLHLIK